jgi:hypothetical protein
MEWITGEERRRIALLVAEGARPWKLHQEINRSRHAIRRAVIALRWPAGREPQRSALGRTMGAGEAGREIGDAGGPVLVGAFALVSLTAHEHRPTSSPFPHQRGDPAPMTTSRTAARTRRRRCHRPETRPSRSRRSDG